MFTQKMCEINHEGESGGSGRAVVLGNCDLFPLFILVYLLAVCFYSVLLAKLSKDTLFKYYWTVGLPPYVKLVDDIRAVTSFK